jgi:transcriptional regulator with XRE-family HTH domain
MMLTGDKQMDEKFKYVLDVAQVDKLRDEKGWSVTTFCERVNLSRPTWYKIVTDKGSTSMENVAKIAAGFGVHPFDISNAGNGYPAPLMGAQAGMVA